jgi:hypothetical protein
MKKLFLIIFLSCLVTFLLTSWTSKKVHNNILNPDSLPITVYDSADAVNLIKSDTFKLNIEPPSMGVRFYKNGIVFLSQTKNEVKMVSDHLSFGTVEAYYASVRDSVPGKHILFSPLSSFPYPCDAITFTNDYDTMYFTRLSGVKNQETIYKAVYKSKDKIHSGWVAEETPETFCTEKATYSHPALSADGKMLIFASNMKGSTGGMDLYVTRNDSNKWSAPKNLGETINTKANEFFPFLDPDNNLYFSSDRPSGYGGYDIFTSKYNGESWDKPVNLLNQINSPEDDLAFIIDKTDGKSAFYSRRKKSGKHEVQLFRVTLRKEVGDTTRLTISYIFNGKPESVSPPITELTKQKVMVADAETQKETQPVQGNQVSAIDTVKKIQPDKREKEEKKEIKDIIVYKVQFLSSTTPKERIRITVKNKIYDSDEYFYLKAYRETIGEFSTYKQAVELQNDLRKSGYPQAFVVIFKNSVRSTDPALFK